MGVIRDTNVTHMYFLDVYMCSRTNMVQPLKVRRYKLC